MNEDEARTDGDEAPLEAAEGPRPDFIVGVGASAGGLEALGEFLKAVTWDGTAFVVVQHLAPKERSLLAQLLGRMTKLEVVTIEDGMKVEANVVYVTPPNVELAILHGVLHTLTPVGSRPSMPIDAFFRSLAQDRGETAIGVVLSGTGSDGTRGFGAIKAEGGITFAQEPTTAKFDGMPRSALESGFADFAMPVAEIAAEVQRLGMQMRRVGTRPASTRHPENLGKLFAVLRSSLRFDLTLYKPSTVERRVRRRMALQRIERVDDYVRLCQESAAERETLRKDVLINVTSFFRDEETFGALRDTILPGIADRKQQGDTIRIWIPACSTGEEAYSIAICLLEELDDRHAETTIQIFGSDLDDDAIAVARRGVYPAAIAADVSAERLRRFFVKTDGGSYQVCRRLRNIVVFSHHDVILDPPFSRLDLLSCRNLLIYLQPAVQQRVFQIFHYALRPDGVLLLGSSETIGDATDLFALIDRKNRVYAAKHVAGSGGVVTRGPSVAEPASLSDRSARAPRPSLGIAQLADRKILEEYGPAGVIINSNLDVLHFRGHTAGFLQQPTGVATHHILRLVRSELSADLKKAIDRAASRSELVIAASQVKVDDGGLRPISLVVQPMQDPESRAPCFLILFRDLDDRQSAPADEPPAGQDDGGEVDQRVRALSHELALTQEYLQATIEELETSNEDLKSANEELQSSNEEMQSSNEELETSREELQSTNEELVTVNDELNDRMTDLSQANDDLHNLLLGVEHPVIIVGLDLRIRRFTRSAERLLGLSAADLDRPVGHLRAALGALDLERVTGGVIDTLQDHQQELETRDHRWYSLRIAPYRTLDRAIRGAVLTLTDIEVTRRRSELTRLVTEYAREFLGAMTQPILVVTADLTVVWVNDAFYRTLSLVPEETIGTPLGNLGPGQWADGGLVDLVETTFQTGAPFERHAVIMRQADGTRGAVVSGRRIANPTDKTHLVVLSVDDIVAEPVELDREGGG